MRRAILPILACFFLMAGSSAGMLMYLNSLNTVSNSGGNGGNSLSSVPVVTAAPSSPPQSGADADMTDAPAAQEPEPEADLMIGPGGVAVDFETYHSINTDILAHIYIPGTNVDYPLMQEFEVGPAESYYLWRDMYKNRNSWGSIFTPKLPQNALDDPHMLIFGHHMSDPTVAFTGLKSWYNTDEGRGEHPYIYLYYPDRTEKWEVWAACQTNKYDMVYTLEYHPNTTAYQNLLDHLAYLSLYGSAPEAPSVSDPIIVLSTCDGGSGTPNRFIVAAKLAETRMRE